MPVSPAAAMSGFSGGMSTALHAILITLEQEFPGISVKAQANLERLIANLNAGPTDLPEAREETIRVAREYFALAINAAPHFK